MKTMEHPANNTRLAVLFSVLGQPVFVATVLLVGVWQVTRRGG